MKLIYITNTRIPSEKANARQSMKMCNAFAEIYDHVEMWTGQARNTHEMKAIKDPFIFYNIQKNFYIASLYQIDSILLARINEFIWANIKAISFAISVLLRLFKTSKSHEFIIYTRVWHVLLVAKLVKLLRASNFKVIYEAHKFSPLLAKVITYSDGLVVINRFLGKKFLDVGFKNITIEHDSVDIREFENMKNYEFNDSKESYKVLYIGSLSKAKGVYTLADSGQYLPKEFSIYFYGGSANDLKIFSEYVSKIAWSKNIFCEKFMPHEKLLQKINDADILVIPNISGATENLYTSPMKLFEYMALRKPILASNIKSIREVLNNKNASFFSDNDPKDLAKQIIFISRNNQTERIKQAFNDVKQYTWQRRAARIKQFISDTSLCAE